MQKMFQIMADRLEKESLVIVTVTASSGAVPRGAGSHMLVSRQGRLWGTIGGGTVEYRSEQIALQVLESGSAREQDFSLTKDDVQELGMICGGEVHVCFSYLRKKDKIALELAHRAEQYLADGRGLWLILNLSQGGRLALYTRETGFLGMEDIDGFERRLGRCPCRIQENDQDYFTEQIGVSDKVYIFGGGHVSQQLVPLLARTGFRCVVLEDRPEFADSSLFPDAVDVKLIDFQKIDQWITVGKDDYACIMTRGHAYDTIIQAQLLRTPVYYIGVIGSAAKKAQVYEQLHAQGFTSEDTGRIISPIGLPILAETPEEIAVSITAQMILQRAKRKK